jgi:hypothetical protein
MRSTMAGTDGACQVCFMPPTVTYTGAEWATVLFEPTARAANDWREASREQRQFKANSAVLCRLRTRRTPHTHLTDPHHVRARSPLGILASRCCYNDIGSARTAPGESCPFERDRDRYPGLVFGRDFDADVFSAATFASHPTSSRPQPGRRQEPTRRSRQDRFRLPQRYRRRRRLPPGPPCRRPQLPDPPTYGHRAQPERIEVAGRERAPY